MSSPNQILAQAERFGNASSPLVPRNDRSMLNWAQKAGNGMKRKPERSSSAKLKIAFRRRMRRAGLRPATIWVYDTASPAFIETCRRQAHAVAESDPDEQLALFLNDL